MTICVKFRAIILLRKNSGHGLEPCLRRSLSACKEHPKPRNRRWPGSKQLFAQWHSFLVTHQPFAGNVMSIRRLWRLTSPEHASLVSMVLSDDVTASICVLLSELS